MRRRYLIESRMQLSVALSMAGVLFALTLAYVIALAASAGDELGPTSQSVQRLGFLVTGAYFLLVSLATVVVGVLVTHRIAGPAVVIEHALRGLRAGDYRRRLTLRKRDHLKSLADELAAFRDELRGERAAREEFHERLERLLDEGELEAARRLNASARSSCDDPCGGVEPDPALPAPRATQRA